MLQNQPSAEHCDFYPLPTEEFFFLARERELINTQSYFKNGIEKKGIERVRAYPIFLSLFCKPQAIFCISKIKSSKFNLFLFSLSFFAMKFIFKILSSFIL